MLDKIYKVLYNELFERVSMVDIETHDGFVFRNAILVKNIVLMIDVNTVYIYKLGNVEKMEKKQGF